MVHTGGTGACRELTVDYVHEVVNGGGGELIRSESHISVFGFFWGLLNRGYVESFHRFSPRCIDRYVPEFVGHHNVRNVDMIACNGMQKVAQ